MASDLKDKIPYAGKVTISLVKSPFYTEFPVNIVNELKQYFQLVRTFRLDDYFDLPNLLDPGNSIFFLI